MNIENISIPTHSDLVNELQIISQSSYNGIKGVWCVSSDLEGPTVGITIHTHGNEPSGLVALWYMRNRFHILERLRCGRVFFVLNNICATQQYFKARTKSEKLEARFVDVNMNRLPQNLLELTDDHRYEIRRARELVPIWREFEFALDIHSTTKQSPPMIIEVQSGKCIKQLTQYFPIRIIIARITEHQLRSPAIAFYGSPGKHIPAVGIETGSHEEKRAFAVAISCVRLFLNALGVIADDVSVHKSTSHHHRYVIGSSVIFPNRNWRLAKIFKMFERVRKGQILATDNEGRKIRALFTGVALFGPPRRQAVKIEDEVLFLAHPQRS